MVARGTTEGQNSVRVRATVGDKGKEKQMMVMEIIF